MMTKTPTHAATLAAGLTAIVALVVLVVAAVSGDATAGLLGIGALMLVPAARNVVIVVVGDRADRPWAVLGLALLLVVALAVFADR